MGVKLENYTYINKGGGVKVGVKNERGKGPGAHSGCGSSSRERDGRAASRTHRGEDL